MPEATPEAVPPKPDEMTDDKVDKLVTHVLDKMGVANIPEMAIAKSEAAGKLAEADVARAEQVKGQMDALRMLVGTLQAIGASTHLLGNGMMKIAHDVDLMKRFLKKLDKKGLMDQLEASIRDGNHDAPPEMGGHGTKPDR
jgi:hypothetical protein